MKGIIFAVLSTFLLFCNDNECRMTISNANPIQFWDDEASTFNGKVVQGIDEHCFFAPWDCDDPITLQVKDTPGRPLILRVIQHPQAGILKEFDFEEIESGIYQLEFTPQVEGICENFRLEIYEKHNIRNQFFDDSLAPWTNISPGVVDWIYQVSPKGALGGVQAPSDDSKILIQPLLPDIGTLQGQIQYTVESRVGLTNPTLRLVLLKNGVIVSTLGTKTVNESIGNTGTLNYNIVVESSDFNQVGVWLDASGPPGGSCEILLTSFTSNPRYSARKKVSDPIDVTFTYPTVLIDYWNAKDFAGIKYQDVSPPLAFKLRVPAMFYHEEFPMENEDAELSDDTIKMLYSKMEAKKVLDTAHMPYYMHQKILTALQHQFVEIDSTPWRMRDPYEIDRGNKRFPMKKARVLLTDQDFIQRNLL